MAAEETSYNSVWMTQKLRKKEFGGKIKKFPWRNIPRTPEERAPKLERCSR